MTDISNLDASAVADLIAAALPTGTQRQLIAIAGPPASGKSTAAEALVAQLTASGERAALLPMDGFHLDNTILEPRGLLPSKGAPETFDAAGFIALIKRIKAGGHCYTPSFDRSRDIAVAGSGEITPEDRLIIIEGNYLLFDEAPWNTLLVQWDHSVFFDIAEPILENRLITRWQTHGLTPDQAHLRAHSNDLPNAKRVATKALPASQTFTYR